MVNTGKQRGWIATLGLPRIKSFEAWTGPAGASKASSVEFPLHITLDTLSLSPFLLKMLAAIARRRVATGITAKTLRSVSTWGAVPQGPPDPILGKIFFRSSLGGGSVVVSLVKEVIC